MNKGAAFPFLILWEGRGMAAGGGGSDVHSYQLYCIVHMPWLDNHDRWGIILETNKDKQTDFSVEDTMLRESNLNFRAFSLLWIDCSEAFASSSSVIAVFLLPVLPSLYGIVSPQPRTLHGGGHLRYYRLAAVIVNSTTSRILHQFDVWISSFFFTVCTLYTPVNFSCRHICKCT